MEYPHLKRWTVPESYGGRYWRDYYGAGVSQHRDSDDLDQSNFAQVLAGLKGLPAFDLEGDDSDGDEICSRVVVSENHWVCGWVEWIAIHKDDVAALALCR